MNARHGFGVEEEDREDVAIPAFNSCDTVALLEGEMKVSKLLRASREGSVEQRRAGPSSQNSPDRCD